VTEGLASVDESAITGESAPCIEAARNRYCEFCNGARAVFYPMNW
jgi:high-affinity K+ transport system ATPase subunit B